MKSKLLLLTLLINTLVSCQVNKSAQKDLITGLFTEGDGISCTRVYLSNGTEEIKRNSFTYGEKFYLNFENITGFNKIDNKVYPGMDLLILDQKRDTMLFKPDMYEQATDGYEISPLLLKANITTANPIHSREKYTFFINIWDKKGPGKFKSEMDFNVKPNSEIIIEKNNISFNEIYLFSSQTKLAIIDNTIKNDETIYVILEGLSGFIEEEGKATIGVSMLAKDSDGTIVVQQKDLLANSSMDISDLKKQLAPNFIFNDPNIKSPVTCEIFIWDKKSDHNIKVTTKVTIK